MIPAAVVAWRALARYAGGHVVELRQPGGREGLVLRAACASRVQQWIAHSTVSLIRISRMVAIRDIVVQDVARYGPPPCRPTPRCKPSSPVPEGCSRSSPRTVLGRPDAGVREPHALAALGGGGGPAAAATTRPSSSTATAPTASATFVQTANGVAHALRDRFGLAKGDRVAVLSQNNPEWCLTFWATVSQGAVLVGLNGWWTTDEIEYGLQDSGAKVLVADQKRFERIAGSPRPGPRPRARVPRRLHPGRRRPGRRPAAARASPSSPAPPPPTSSTHEIAEDDHAVIFYTSGTTGRPKGAISTHRSMIANLQNTMYNAVAGSMAGGGALPDGGGGQNVVAVHLAAVPRVGLPLDARGRAARRPQAGDARGPLHARDGARADPGAQASRCGPPCPRWCGGCASTPTATTTTRRRCAAWPSAARRRPTSSSA